MLYFLFHNYASFLNCDESFITEKSAQMDGYVYQSTRRCEISQRKYEFNQEIRFSFPKLWHVLACLGANELWHSAVLSMLLARLTCWLLAMIHATFNVCLRLVPQSARLSDTIYDWIYEERVRPKKNYQRTAIFRISKRLYHWHAHISHE